MPPSRTVSPALPATQSDRFVMDGSEKLRLADVLQQCERVGRRHETRINIAPKLTP